MPQITLASQSEAQHKQMGQCVSPTQSLENHIQFTTALPAKDQ